MSTSFFGAASLRNPLYYLRGHDVIPEEDPEEVCDSVMCV
jgi:hypothetical protein